MQSAITKISHNERDYDRYFIEEIAFNEKFFGDFARKIGLKLGAVNSVRHSVSDNFGGDAWGETDILIQTKDGATLLIENKISSFFQPDQAKRYRARAKHYRESVSVVRTVLIAPEACIDEKQRSDWDHTCSYADIAACMVVRDARSRWRQSLFLEAESRAERVVKLARTSRESEEILAFKAAWYKMANENAEWIANVQRREGDEFLYAPSVNRWGLRIWHHPFKGYLSVQNLEKFPVLKTAKFQVTLPEGFLLKEHWASVYLDAPTPPIDMTASFSAERKLVEEGMAIAGRAVALTEAGIEQG